MVNRPGFNFDFGGFKILEIGQRQRPVFVMVSVTFELASPFWILGHWALGRGRGLYWFVWPPRQPLSGRIPSQSEEKFSHLGN